MRNYREAWEWLIAHRNAPFATILYVSSVTLVVKIRNIFTDKKHNVMVEVYTQGEEAPYTHFLLPRICITNLSAFEKGFSDIIENVVAQF